MLIKESALRKLIRETIGDDDLYDTPLKELPNISLGGKFSEISGNDIYSLVVNLIQSLKDEGADFDPGLAEALDEFEYIQWQSLIDLKTLILKLASKLFEYIKTAREEENSKEPMFTKPNWRKDAEDKHPSDEENKSYFWKNDDDDEGGKYLKMNRLYSHSAQKLALKAREIDTIMQKYIDEYRKR